MNSLLPVLFAHVVVDLALQSERLRIQLKAQVELGVYSRHGLLVFGAMWVALTAHTGTPGWALGCALIVSIIHLGVDLGKSVALRKRGALRQGGAWLLGDCDDLVLESLILAFAQVLHVIALWTLTGIFFPPHYDLSTLLWYANTHLLNANTSMTGVDLLLYLGILLLLLTKGSARVLQFVERAFDPGEIQDVTVRTELRMAGSALPGTASSANQSYTYTKEGQESPPIKPGVSYVVGMLERLAILASCWVPWVGPVALGLKSIARYNQFKHRAFVEYYIVGTLCSLVLALPIAWLIYRALTVR